MALFGGPGRDERTIEDENWQRAKKRKSAGIRDRMENYLYPRYPINFVLSGGSYPDVRYESIEKPLAFLMGEMPMIILHDGDESIEAIAGQAHERIGGEVPFWKVGRGYPEDMRFEPFFGMTEQQTVNLFKKLAETLGYQPTPRFERVVRAHIRILEIRNTPICLTEFYYLCSFTNLEEFHDNIMQLPCDGATAARIWSDLDTDDSSMSGAFDLFRSIVGRLAEEAGYSGWSPEYLEEYNCLTALQAGAVFVIPVNNNHSELLLTYLAEELKLHENGSYFLLIDGVRIRNHIFMEYLCTDDGKFVGVMAENAVNLIGGTEEAFMAFAGRVNCFVLYAHPAAISVTVFSKIIGNYEHLQMQNSVGVNRRMFRVMPEGQHENVTYTIINRYRVMPEEITGLGDRQAIIYNAESNEVVYYR